jgi:photosystem II stability/assembly factor-like uncharacterized protein
MPESRERGAVYALATTPDFIYQKQGMCCAACAAGLYLSDHNADTWQKIPHEQKPPAVTTAAFTVDSDNVVPNLFAGAYGGILRSADGGASWHFAPLAAPPPVLSSLVVSPDFSRDGTILAGTLEDGIFRSEDRGRFWSPANFGLLDLKVLSMTISPNFAADETVFAGTESGIFRSTNGGRAWRETSFSMDKAPVLCLAFAQASPLFAGTESHGIFASHDYGQTWVRLDTGLLTGAVNQIIPSISDLSHLLVLHDDSLLVSRDGGQGWNAWSATVSHGVTAVTAPAGILEHAHLLVGLNDGRIVTI